VTRKRWKDSIHGSTPSSWANKLRFKLALPSILPSVPDLSIHLNSIMLEPVLREVWSKTKVLLGVVKMYRCSMKKNPFEMISAPAMYPDTRCEQKRFSQKCAVAVHTGMLMDGNSRFSCPHLFPEIQRRMGHAFKILEFGNLAMLTGFAGKCAAQGTECGIEVSSMWQQKKRKEKKEIKRCDTKGSGR
jgi:hypothetical protein